MRLIGAGRPASRAADPRDELTTRLAALAPALDGDPDAEWKSRTRARLVAMAAVRPPEPASPVRRLPAPGKGRRGGWRTRLTGGLAGAAAAVTAVAAAVTLSADGRPGDALHGFERGAEQTQPALAGDARGRTASSGSAAPTTAPGRTDLLFPDVPIPDLPVADLPTLFPGPEGTVRPPEPGTAGDSKAGKLPLDVDGCPPDLPVLGDC